MGRKTKSPRQTMIDAEPDMISNLPGHVIDEIFSHLPIRDAVRTSVLSKIWKNKWHTLPNLVFDKQGVSNVSENFLVNQNKLVKIVDHVLLAHSRPINMFKFSVDYLISENIRTGIDRWILHLIRKSIKKFALAVWVDEEKDRYKIPWCLFSFQSLHHLKLECCLLQPPKIFEGFKNLKSLYLRYVTVAQDAFENLMSGCPMLEKLELEGVVGLTQLNIHAPNLKIFEISEYFEGEISFYNTFQLATVIIDLCWECWGYYPENNQSTFVGDSNNFLKFFNHLPRLQSLVIDSYLLKYLAADVLPVKLPAPCIHLTYLSVSIHFDDLKEIAAALCLVRSSPNLQKLKIFEPFEQNTSFEQDTFSDTYCWEDTFSRPDTPIQLRHVTIDRIFGSQPELDFIRFLLLYSPELEKVIVKHSIRPELVTELIRFKRASEEAEVIYHVSNS